VINNNWCTCCSSNSSEIFKGFFFFVIIIIIIIIIINLSLELPPILDLQQQALEEIDYYVGGRKRSSQSSVSSLLFCERASDRHTRELFRIDDDDAWNQKITVTRFLKDIYLPLEFFKSQHICVEI
jgi:hypothetical protein